MIDLKRDKKTGQNVRREVVNLSVSSTHSGLYKKVFLAIMVASLFIACRKEEHERTNDSKVYAFDITAETDAELFLLHKDSSYAIFDYENESGLPVLLINSSLTNPIEEGISVTIDNSGFPKIIRYKDQVIICGNFKENTFDAVIIDGDSEPQYYWELETQVDFDSLVSAVPTKSISSETKAWLSLSLKSIGIATTVIGAVAAIAAGAPIASIIGVAGLCLYAYDVCISKGSNSEVEIADGSLSVVSTIDWDHFKESKEMNLSKGGIIGLVTAFGEYWAEEMQNEIDREFHEALYGTIMDDVRRPYQIKLSQYYIEMPSNPSKAVIFVTTQSQWEIDKEDMGWCVAKKANNNVINVETKETYTMGNSRSVTFMLYSQNGSVPCVYLTVEQVGIEYTISPTSLYFEATGGQRGFTISVESPATVGSVKALNEEWCHVSKNGVSPVSVIVKADQNKDKVRNTLVVVSFKLDENTITTTVPVSQEGEEVEETGFFAGSAFYNTSWMVTTKGNEETTGTYRKVKLVNGKEVYYTEPWISDENGDYEYSYIYSFHGDQIDLSSGGETGSLYIVNNQLYCKEEGVLVPLDDFPIFINIVAPDEMRWTSQANCTENEEHITYNMTKSFIINSDKIAGEGESTYITQYVGSNTEFIGFTYYKSINKDTYIGEKETCNFYSNTNALKSLSKAELRLLIRKWLLVPKN